MINGIAVRAITEPSEPHHWISPAMTKLAPAPRKRPKDVQKAKRVAKPLGASAAENDAQVAGNGVVEPNGREIKVAAPTRR